ncbi:hypothetical protein [Croceibacterium aestuarii]|uniref:hypothetical protein n=1 Tax=Croceibacterium aestuarii TaxID=3064139 RepID=UPI00272E8F6A|nr:hypothetical protein [Croceibacterium sp. D39]
MNTDRRTLIAAGTALTALFATGACAQEDQSEGQPLPNGPAKGPSGLMEIIHIYADEKGVSHVGKVTVQGTPKPLPVTGVVATSIAQGTEDWHQAPRKTFTINVVGDIEAEVGDGTKIPIGKGDLVYLEDRSGKGHVTRLLTPVANLFLQMPDDFDLVAWANAPVDPDSRNG